MVKNPIKLGIMYDKNEGRSPIDNRVFGWPATSKTLRPWLERFVQSTNIDIYNFTPYNSSQELETQLTNLRTGSVHIGNLNELDVLYFKGFGTVTKKTEYENELKNMFYALQSKLQTPSINDIDIEMDHFKKGKESLLDLQSAGITVPYSKKITEIEELEDALSQYEKGVVKPVKNSFGGKNVNIVTYNDYEATNLEEELEQGTTYLFQEFRSEVAQGERSLFFLNGNYTYGVEKIPKKGNFKANKDEADLSRYHATQKDIGFATEVLKATKLTNKPYCRVDIIGSQDNPLVMELTKTAAASTYLTQLGLPNDLIQVYASFFTETANKHQ